MQKGDGTLKIVVKLKYLPIMPFLKYFGGKNSSLLF